MAAFLEEAHGRHTVQRQIDLAEQLGLGKALFQEFRKETDHRTMEREDGSLVGGDWNMNFIFPSIWNNHPD